MQFSSAWDTLGIGDEVAVSNDMARPSGLPDSMGARIWRSHNFTGHLVERIDGERRFLRFDLPPNEGGNVIGFAIAEDGGHDFEPVDGG